MKKEKNIIKAIDLLLEDIKENAISKKHRHAEINWDCPECKFRIGEGFLNYYRDLFRDK